MVSIVVLAYSIWVERYNSRIKQIVEEKKAKSELCQVCPKYKTCYALCDKYRRWEENQKKMLKPSRE